MTNKQILRKAIEKAVKNGYKEILLSEVDEFLVNLRDDTCYNIIFSHDFARAFAKYIYQTKQHFMFLNLEEIKDWPEEEIITTIQFEFLIAMVVEKKPLEYLERFL